MEVTREMAHAMAAWWGDKISGHGARHDNGDHNNLASVFAGILADTMTEEANESKVNKFVDILTEKILEQAGNGHLLELRYNLDCDYGPSKFLSDVAKEAGINPNNFPWKTSMAVRENRDGDTVAEVYAGYGAGWKQIWPPAEDYRPYNGVHHYGVKGMKWGIRKHQNEDGSLTQLGKEYYAVGSNGMLSGEKEI